MLRCRSLPCPVRSAGQVRPRHCKAIGKLTARPAESEYPVTEINHFEEHQGCEKSLTKNPGYFAGFYLLGHVEQQVPFSVL
jgi:hypothetical protein